MKQHAPQVTQVAAWRTQDGELFATAQQANAHAARLNLLHWYRSGNAIRSAVTDEAVCAHDVADWLLDNRAAVLEFLLTSAHQEPRHAAAQL